MSRSDSLYTSIPRPQKDSARLTVPQLSTGKIRLLAQLEPASDSNTIYVRFGPGDQYTAVIDAKWSDEDSRRSQNDWKTSDDLYDLYLEVGRSLQVPTFWYHSELEPYFPYPKPTIDWLPGRPG